MQRNNYEIASQRSQKEAAEPTSPTQYDNKNQYQIDQMATSVATPVSQKKSWVMYGKAKEESPRKEVSSLPKNANILKHDFFCQRLFKFI